MKKSILFRINGTFVFSLFFITSMFGNGKASISADPTVLSVGEITELSVLVSDITTGTCTYTITIPDDILNYDGTELELEDKTITNSAVTFLQNGNKTHGKYTAYIPGVYEFDFKVTNGDKKGENASVAFHPLPPTAKEPLEIRHIDFTASWEDENDADFYEITLLKEKEIQDIYDNINELYYKFTDLTPGTNYSYKVRSNKKELFSLEYSEEIEVVTDRPSLSYDEFDPFDIAILGDLPVSTTIILQDKYLLDDVSVKVEPEGAFTIDKFSFDPEENKIIEVTFTPDKGGEYNAELILSTSYAYDLHIPLKAYAVPPAPTALEAEDQKGSRFTAKWEESSYAESYLITVRDFDNIIVEPYNDLDVGNVTDYEVTNLLPESSYSYTIKTVNNGASSNPSNIMYTQTIEGAVITYSNISSFNQEINNSSRKTMRINGTNLTDIISVELTGEYFTVDKDEVPMEGGYIAITYNSPLVGNHQAELKLNSATAEEVTVNIYGTSIPLPTIALTASDITDDSFMANWEKAESASDYLITVIYEGEILIEDRSTQNEIYYPLSDLNAGKSYSYYVKVIENDIASNPSNTIYAVTHTAPKPVSYADKTSIRIKWNEVIGAEKYEISLYHNGTIYNDYEEIQLEQATEYTFSDLPMNTEFAYEVTSIFGTIKYTTELIYATTIGDYGEQIRNSDFESWDYLGDTGGREEPTNWNSFMKAGGDIADGDLGSTVKKQKIKMSDEVRPNSKGSRSSVIWATEILGFKANGNMTTGQIRANNMTDLESPENHNKTFTKDQRFNAPFSSSPDSLTVWVKYVPVNASGNEARATATIHDNFNYQDPTGEDPTIEMHAYSKAELNFSATEQKDWQRLSIPFERTENNIDPAFMLVSFTTNKTPGKGSGGDSLYIDDMVMVYKPAVEIKNTKKSTFSFGEKITVEYILTGTMSPTNLNAEPNIVYLELSDANGSFENPTELASRVTDISGDFEVNIPEEIISSKNYKLRIVTTNYPLISEESNSFEIRSMPVAPKVSNATNITSGSFTANWEEVEDATGYILLTAGREINVEAESTSYEVKNLSPETSYTYTVKTVINELISEESLPVNLQTASGGSIGYEGENTLVTNMNIIKKENITITGYGLIDEISVNLLNNTSGFFFINEENLPVEGGNIEISYEPASLGIHTARIRLQSTFVEEDIIIDLTGVCILKSPNALEAEAITPVSFTAQWESTGEAENYILNVSDENGNFIEDYSDIILENYETSYKIENLSPATIYSYNIISIAGDFKSEPSDNIEVATSLKPYIKEIEEIDFIQDINISDSEVIEVEAFDLFGENGITLLFSEIDYFSIDTLGFYQSNKFTVTYLPKEVNHHTTNIIISAEYADDVTLSIKGTARPLAPVAKEATEVTLTSFMANWEVSEDIDSYLLTVKDSRENPVNGYNQLNVGTATWQEVTGLSRLNNYTYYIQVVKNEIESLPSYTITIRTSNPNPGGTGFDLYADGKINFYPNPVSNFIFIEGDLNDSNFKIIDNKGLIILQGNLTENKISVNNLPAGNYILNIGNLSTVFIKK